MGDSVLGLIMLGMMAVQLPLLALAIGTYRRAQTKEGRILARGLLISETLRNVGALCFVLIQTSRVMGDTVPLTDELRWIYRVGIMAGLTGAGFVAYWTRKRLERQTDVR